MAFKSKILGLVLAAGLLGACSAVHPGTAAMVDGDPITMSEADSAAQTFCIVNIAGQGGTGSFDNAEIRRQALTSLIIVKVAEKIAADRDIEVKVPHDDRAEVEAFRDMLEPDQRDGFDKIIEDNLRFGVIAVELGRDSNPEITDENQLFELGMAELSTTMAGMDIDIDPRFAMSDMGEQIADSGSLSVASVNFDAPSVDERAIATQCTAL